MAKKEIKWANKELPGLSFDELNKMSSKSLAISETGKHNVESGHLAKIASSRSDKKIKASIKNVKKATEAFNNKPEEFKKDVRSRGGKTSGNNAKKSGQFNSYCKLGAKVASELRMQNTKIYKQKLYDLITLEEFTIKDIEHLYMEFNHLNDSQMIRIWIRDTDYFLFVRKNGNGKIYKKI